MRVRMPSSQRAMALFCSLSLAVFLSCPLLVLAQTSGGPGSAASVDERLQRLEQRQQQLENELRQKDAEIQQLKNALAQPAGGAAGVSSLPAAAADASLTEETPAAPVAAASGATPAPLPAKWGNYTPNLGFRVADTDVGSLNVSLYTYVRYLNQHSLEDSYTNAFGTTTRVQQRNDVFLNKVFIKFLGWILDPKFTYLTYAWTNNTAQGQGAQVVLAGNLNYAFNKYFTLGGGVDGLPGVRTVEGNFPYWLGVDNRLMADEFFRPSYTFGFWARGQITDAVRYRIMAGNNLSALGVSTAQLSNHFNTQAAALVWEPTRDYGIGYGDFEDHQSLASRLGAHFTHSVEDKQSQPNTDAFSNTQIRLSDGTVIFTPNIFGPGITITQLQFLMEDVDFGLKYRGWALEGEYYFRQLNDFQGTGTTGLRQVNDNGFQLLLSYMLIPRSVQLYVGGSRVAGDYGNPHETRLGVSVFPFKNRIVRWNTQLINLDRSPVGNSTLPYTVGATGTTFNSDFELAL